ncbi:hypothetical protein AGOR_G00181220 [Albula goreensis]|uniref:Transmembrane protein 110 n=1 Tax=Albula goreensis TaxID=1534307 RepID=A0A8T3CUP0_9TELE|nr:hypothetical protein AGOR_G00181220 [Albula goreensis]
MVLEKSVISLVLLIPGWTNLQEVLLDYIPNPQLELVLVMLIVPFFVNAIMFWVVDSLMMRKYKILKTSETPRDTGKQTESLPWVTGEESQVLLMADPEPDTEPEPSEGEQDGTDPGPSHRSSAGTQIPGWVVV